MFTAKDTIVTNKLKTEANDAICEQQKTYYLQKLFLADNRVALEFLVLFYEPKRGR